MINGYEALVTTAIVIDSNRASVKVKSYHAPFSVPVTVVLTASMRKQFISELECSSFILL